MSIHIVYGKPGSGKSRYGVGKLIEQLVTTDAKIGTNFPLEIPRLNQYLQERHPNVEINLFERLFIIPDDELKVFFQWYGPPVEGHPKGVNDGRKIIYHIDEAQIPFNALDWAAENKKGERLCFNFLTQHRKIPCDVWAYTQHYDNLDQQFRRLAQDFRQCTNHRLKKIGVFRGFDKFTCHHYEKESRKKTDAYFEETYTIDPKGIGSCYDTARGIGVKGVGADKGSRAKGLTLGWGVVGIGVLSLSVWLVPMGLGKLFGVLVKGGQGENTPVRAQPVESTAGAIGQPLSNVTSELPTTPSPSTAKETVDESPALVRDSATEIYVVGVVRMGKKINVILSNGRVLDESDPSLVAVYRNRVIIDGKTYYLRAEKKKELAEASRVAQTHGKELRSVKPQPPTRNQDERNTDGASRDGSSAERNAKPVGAIEDAGQGRNHSLQ